MLTLGPLAFASPWILLGLAALPAIWWLLRVSPPLPKRVRFPAIRLLVGLVREEETPAHTPLWLLLLRMTIAALIVLALAEPLWNPTPRIAGSGPSSSSPTMAGLRHRAGPSAARRWMA